VIATKRNVPLSRPLIGEQEKAAVLRVLESGGLAQGARVAEFEQHFAAYIGVAHAVATSSGTTALHLALLAHGIGPGDEVITSSFTFIASPNAVLFTGATPIFADIDPVTFNLDPAAVERAITPRTRAIMPVHLFGLPADMDRFLDIARRHDLLLIEDAAQAHGAAIRGRRAGSFATGCFSFYPTKNMTTGEGGIITTNDEQVAERARLLRSHGMKVRYHHDMLGYNFRMSDIHAAIGIVQMDYLEQWNEIRREHAAYLSRRLQGVVVPTEPEGYRHNFHQYTVRVPDGERDALLTALTQAGVGTGVYYPIPAHQQPVYLERGYDVSLPVTEQACAEVLSLPVNPLLSSEDLDFVVGRVNALQEHRR
jgi:dTDP-4-amino-4,6-dideoxygalactose transaminase